MLSRQSPLILLVALCFAATLAAAGGSIVRYGEDPEARKAKEHGDQFLASKRYADALDCYLQALEADAEYPEVHYNLGVVFLKGYRDYGLAAHHFRRYLSLDPYAEDLEQIEALLAGLDARRAPPLQERGVVIKELGGRLLISGAWEAPRELLVDTEDLSGTLLIAYRYSDVVLTERIREAEVLDLLNSDVAVFRAP